MHERRLQMTNSSHEFVGDYLAWSTHGNQQNAIDAMPKFERQVKIMQPDFGYLDKTDQAGDYFSEYTIPKTTPHWENEDISQGQYHSGLRSTLPEPLHSYPYHYNLHSQPAVHQAWQPIHTPRCILVPFYCPAHCSSIPFHQSTFPY